jgi:hypothetical protein
MAHEGVPLIVIQRQLGHSNLGITSIYLQGIDNPEIIDTVHSRRAPMVRSAPRFACSALHRSQQARDPVPLTRVKPAAANAGTPIGHV